MDENNPNDRKLLGQAYAALCLAWGREADGHQLKVYQAALRAVPADLISEAAGLLVRDATLRAMPTPGQWLAACEDAAAARAQAQLALPAGPTPHEEPYCDRCTDTGWAYKNREGVEYEAPPAGGSGPEAVVYPCRCRDHNPRWLRKHRPPKVPKYTSKRKPREDAGRLEWDRD